jgi:Lamin Tail Domain
MSASGTSAMLLLLALRVPGCNGPDASVGQEPRWISDSGLHASGFGRAAFVAQNGKEMAVLVYRSSAFDPADGPIWFVMHGADRDVDRYIRVAAPVAERHQALAIALHFSKTSYPTSSDYTLERASYAEIERAFDLVRGSLDGRQMGYHLFGHSAGAQFTHRLLTFLPAPRVISAVAANAGWYTLPINTDPRRHAMPYGLGGSGVQPAELTRFYATRFTVLLGEHDTLTAADDELVRGSPEAEAQGPNRLERGRHYFAVAQAQAGAQDAPFAWRLAVVPRARHDAAQMIWSAGFLTFVPAAEPCTATKADAARGLVITEILADPPRGTAGDANRDGVRDPEDDEFVEIVNRGTTPVCLAGWTLGDAANPRRHTFPLGRPLGPGEVLVLFGGGVPTGRFGDALVQAAADGLSLQATGDVLSLRDAEGVVVQQVSWGDCAGSTCAEDHRSLAGAARYSPGIANVPMRVGNERGR